MALIELCYLFIQALNRVRSAVELDSFTSVEPYLKHSTSAIDTTSCFYQVRNINKGEPKWWRLAGEGEKKLEAKCHYRYSCDEGRQTYCSAEGHKELDPIKRKK